MCKVHSKTCTRTMGSQSNISVILKFVDLGQEDSHISAGRGRGNFYSHNLIQRHVVETKVPKNSVGGNGRNRSTGDYPRINGNTKQHSRGTSGEDPYGLVVTVESVGAPD